MHINKHTRSVRILWIKFKDDRDIEDFLLMNSMGRRPEFDYLKETIMILFSPDIYV